MFQPTVAFLADLARHNDKAWFEEHRARYDRDVKAPCLAFVEAMAPRLAALSPALVTGPKAISRIHRDTRFSVDKSPYKDWMGFHFTLGARKEAPGLYLRVAPDRGGLGAGVYALPAPALFAVRTRIADPGSSWKKVRRAVDAGGFTPFGDALKNVPRGFPPEHPFAEDLKRKTCAFSRPIDVTQPEDALLDEVEEGFRAAWPVMTFLADALGLDAKVRR